MSHIEQQLFVKLASECFSEHFSKVRVIEIGSYDVNGSIRQLFPVAVEFVGIDLVTGPGVDVVCGGDEYDEASNSLDVAISCECFEHNPFWLETFINMIRMVKPQGMVLFTCASRGRVEHGTKRTMPGASPGTQAVGLDYYQNLTENDFRTRINLSLHFDVFEFFYIPSTHDLYFIGFKRPRTNGSRVDAANQDSLDVFRKGVIEIGRLRWKGKSMLSKFMILALDSPIIIASYLLSDQLYQYAAIPYSRATVRIKSYFSNSTL